MAQRELGDRRLGALALATLALVAALGHVDPLGALHERLAGADTQLLVPDKNPEAWDADRGATLLDTLRRMPPVPAGARRVLVFGNSQQYTVSLPKGVAADPNRHVVIASMRLAADLERAAPRRFRVFNAGNDNQNFAEALWHALYWFEVAPSPPGALVLQVSFDTLRKTGVRGGYQTLLGEPRFGAALHALMARRERGYHADWRAAESKWRERQAPLDGKAREKGWTQWSPEPALRDAMGHVALFAHREQLKISLYTALYDVRVHAFGISPTTRRHVTGAPLEQNFAALEDLVDLARAKGAAVVVYNAPTNPAVDMFYREEYDAYLARVQELCAARGVPFADFAHAVGAEHWGHWQDGPDPIHFDEQGHAIVSDLWRERFVPGLVSAANGAAGE